MEARHGRFGEISIYILFVRCSSDGLQDAQPICRRRVGGLAISQVAILLKECGAVSQSGMMRLMMRWGVGMGV